MGRILRAYGHGGLAEERGPLPGRDEIMHLAFDEMMRIEALDLMYQSTLGLASYGKLDDGTA